MPTSVPMSWYLILSAILFGLGVAGFIFRRNIITVFMSIELMLNAVNLTFITFSYTLKQVDGHIFSFFVMVVAAGNSGSGCSTVSDPPSFYDPSFTVGALNTGADTIASFSSRGPPNHAPTSFGTAPTFKKSLEVAPVVERDFSKHHAINNAFSIFHDDRLWLPFRHFGEGNRRSEHHQMS